MTARSSRSNRHLAGIVVALATALSLPGVGQAHHTTCTAQGSSDPNTHVSGACPEFSPGWSLDVSYPFRDTPASINLEMSQADHESSALAWEWFLPKDWRFNTSIRPAQKASGGVAASCNDLFDGAGAPTRAEIVSDGNAMMGRIGAARTMTFWGASRASGSPAKPRAHSNLLAFWKSAGGVTDLCLRLDTSTGTSDSLVLPVTLTQVDLGDESPYGWKVSVPTEGIPPQITGADFSMVSLDIELDGLTGGRWHLENGIPAKTVFSKAPRVPVQTRIGTRAVACMNGADTLAACADANEIAFPYSGLREFPFSVMLPPVYAPTAWSSITKAGDTTLAGAGNYGEKPVKGFGFSQDTTDLSVNWTALTPTQVPAGVTPAGYVLAAHKVTASIQPTTEAEIEAGRVLFARDFSNTPARAISFDLSTMPENAQLGTVDGKYNVSLVTVYNTPYGDGYRSDGLCDGPSLTPPVADNGQGVLCPADRPLWSASGAGRDDGTSLYQVLVRGDAWPRRYVYQAAGQPFGVLLLDIANKRGEYTIWGSPKVERQLGQVPAPEIYSIGPGSADQGASQVFRASDDLMFEPTGAASGIVRFGNFDLESQGFTWQFAAQIQGIAPHAAIDGAIPDARGQFTMYNARGGDADWLLHAFGSMPRPPGANPADYPAAVVAHMQANQPSGSPQMIMGDFNGSAF